MVCENLETSNIETLHLTI